MSFKITVLLIFISMPLFSQQKTAISVFENKIKERSTIYTTKENFKKAQFFFLQKEWDSVIVYSKRQLNSLNQNQDFELRNFCYFFRGYSFQKKKLFNESKKEFLKISKDFIFHQYSRMYLGEIELEQHNFQKAITYFKAIELLNAGNYWGIKKGSIENNLGLCYLHLKINDTAEFYLLKSSKIQEIEKDTLKLIGAYGNIATMYYDQYKDDIAISYFKKAYQLSKHTKNFSLKSTTALNMAVVEENRKKLIKALTYRKEYEQWNDSLNNQNKIWDIAQIEKRDAIREKQKEVIQLQLEKKVKIVERNGFIYSSITLLCLLVTGVYFYYEKVKANKTILAQKEVLNELNATKDYLFSVVAHDLRSPVNAIRKEHNKLIGQIANRDIQNIEKTVDTTISITESMYSLLNNILHWSLEQSKQLVFIIQTYALQPIIEHVLFDFKNLAVAKHIDIQTNLNTMILANFDRESLKVVLRNLIDNAIKYTPEKGTISITTTTDTNASYIEITDVGIGFSKEQMNRIHNLKTVAIANIDRSKGVGLGLLLCITLIQKNKGSLDIKSSLGKGSIIKITLPKA